MSFLKTMYDNEEKDTIFKMFNYNIALYRYESVVKGLKVIGYSVKVHYNKFGYIDNLEVVKKRP